jgi:hypothetical protein
MMMTWTYQLVFKFDASNVDDFDQLIALELSIERGLPKGAKLDGHDFGLGEFNIFIHTDYPVAVFEPVREIIGHARWGIPFSAGYRNFNEDEYTVLWPLSSTKFVVS